MRRIHFSVPSAALVASALASAAAAQSGFTTLYNIAGQNPVGVSEAGGVLYSGAYDITLTGFNCGMVFSLTHPFGGGGWIESVVYAFPGGIGAACFPLTAPLGSGQNVLYGLSQGGAYNWGAFYDLLPPASSSGPWTESVLYSFPAGPPTSGLIPGPGGSFYVLDGTPALRQLQPPASSGGSWTATVLYTLPAPPVGGAPGTLAMGPGGVLYATMLYGGTAPPKLGAVLHLTPPASSGGAWMGTLIHSFGFDHGALGGPNELTVANDGTIYGTAIGSNQFGDGASGVYTLTPPATTGGAWSYTVLKNFGRNNGIHPGSPLMLVSGNVYGTMATSTGGAVFEMQPPATTGGAWTITYLHQFTNGQAPGGTFVMDTNGTIYGATAAQPGQPPSGTIYALSTK